jgi:hypothetical protein
MPCPPPGGNTHALQDSHQMLQIIYNYSTQHLHYSYFNAKSPSFEMSVINTHGSNSYRRHHCCTRQSRPGLHSIIHSKSHERVSGHRRHCTLGRIPNLFDVPWPWLQMQHVSSRVGAVLSGFRN